MISNDRTLGFSERFYLAPCLALATAFLSGCATSSVDLEDDIEPVGVAEGALTNDNALSLNALSLNALSLNALSLNALSLNGLSQISLTAIKSSTPIGTLARQALKYMVSCALESSSSFSFSWTDSQGVIHPETYLGLLGLAPGWAVGALDTKGQRMVSACLAARVNWYGISVSISSRSLQPELKTKVGTQELQDYPNVEGAFWGNLFSATPYINACYNAPNVAYSRGASRDCAVGHLSTDPETLVTTTVPCGMINLLGSCANYCQGLNGAGQYYPSCVDLPNVSAATTKYVITTALQ